MGRPVVLVVDDDRHIQEAVREELQNREYEVVIASDGQSALALLASLRPDVMVLDLELPEVSGPMVAAALRRMEHPPRLLVCSGSAFAPEIAADIEADGILLKPFVRADLRAEIERLLGDSGGGA